MPERIYRPQVKTFHPSDWPSPPARPFEFHASVPTWADAEYDRMAERLDAGGFQYDTDYEMLYAGRWRMAGLVFYNPGAARLFVVTLDSLAFGGTL